MQTAIVVTGAAVICGFWLFGIGAVLYESAQQINQIYNCDETETKSN